MTAAGSSADSPGNLGLGGQLAEVRRSINSTQQRIKDEEALLREARKRLQALRTELARSTEQEARLVRALGGEDAAAAAVAAAAAGAQQGCREERCCSASACFDGA